MKKRKIKQLIILTVMLLSLSSSSIAQESMYRGTELNKNSIYGNVGIGGFYFTATGYYERILKQKMWNSNISSFVKGGFGGYALWGDGGMYVLAQYGILTGAKKHHLEVGLGPSFIIDGDLSGQSEIFYVTGTLGYRIQKPGGKFIFRTGLSWPEALYIGLGYSF